MIGVDPGAGVRHLEAGAAVGRFEADAGNALPTLRAGQGSIGRLAITPDGSALVSFGHDGTIDCWAVGGARTR